jgi:integrase
VIFYLEKVRCRWYGDAGAKACHVGGVELVASKKDIPYSLVKDGDMWTVRVRTWDNDKLKMVYKSKSTGLKVSEHTKREAQKIAPSIAEKLAGDSQCMCIGPAGGSRFSYYVELWLEAKERNVRANTAKSYRDYAKCHVLPRFGSWNVEDITWRDLEQYAASLLKKLSLSSVKKIFIVIKGALDDAIRDGAISSNPASLVRWPKESREQKGVSLTSDEARQLLQASERAEEPLRAVVTLGLVYGLRLSEICGMRWIDIDFKKKTMKVRHTVTQNGDVRLDEDHTKTRTSERTLHLAENTVQYFKDLRREQQKNGLPLDKVVAWPDGRPVRADSTRRMFYRLLDENGIRRIRIHDLRHTAASLLAAGGIPPQELKEFLGHSDVSVTLEIYTHVFENASKNVSDKMDGILWKEPIWSGNWSGLDKIGNL